GAACWNAGVSRTARCIREPPEKRTDAAGPGAREVPRTVGDRGTDRGGRDRARMGRTGRAGDRGGDAPAPDIAGRALRGRTIERMAHGAQDDGRRDPAATQRGTGTGQDRTDPVPDGRRMIRAMPARGVVPGAAGNAARGADPGLSRQLPARSGVVNFTTPERAG